MAVRTDISPRSQKSRALFAGAFLALCLGQAAAHAQTVGPVANFGPAPIDLQSTSRPEAGAVSAQQSRNGAQPSIEARPLLAPSSKAAPAAVDGAAAAPSEPASWPRVLGALGVVIGLIFVVRFVIKRVAATGGLRGQLGAGGRAPSGVLEVLGRYPISRGHSLVLLRVDQRVLLLSQSSSGFSALANFDEPSDVASLLMKTRDEESESLSGRFKQMLSAFERDPSMGNASDQIDLTRRAPLISRRPAQPAPAGVQRVATPREAQDAIRKRLATLRGSAA
jgi:flagellar biogenesis protein FliO